MKKLYQYAVLFHEHENSEKGKVYKDTKILVEPKFILAASEKEVIFKKSCCWGPATIEKRGVFI